MIVTGVISVLGLNLVGLAFTGMEHSLHVLLTLLGLYGLVRFKEDGQVRAWWILSVVVAPFVRFEGMSTVLLVTSFLLGQRRIVPAITCLGLVGAGMAVWWIVMSRLELPFLPSSVAMKLDLQASTGGISSFLLMRLARNIESNLNSRAGLILFAIAAALLLRATPKQFIRCLQSTGPQFVGPAVALFGAGLIVAHLAVGKEGWFVRYEAYVLIGGVVCLIAAFYRAIPGGRRRWQWAILAGCALAVLQPYTLATLRTPTAAAHVFAQQYQMHRLAADILRVPVGVNDLGWVSFRNDNYVLDFWGLGSEVARKARMAAVASGRAKDGVWMNDIARGRRVQVAMIYEAYLPAPADWIKVAELQLNMRIITPAHGVVSIFVLDPELLGPVIDSLRVLEVTLPSEASLRILAVP